jgi:hypothetical protein
MMGLMVRHFWSLQHQFSRMRSVRLGRTVETYRDRILSVDTRVARRWGRLSARIGHGGGGSFDRRYRSGAWADLS